jgi:hypothetical protein
MHSLTRVEIEDALLELEDAAEAQFFTELLTMYPADDAEAIERTISRLEAAGLLDPEPEWHTDLSGVPYDARHDRDDFDTSLFG